MGTVPVGSFRMIAIEFLSAAKFIAAGKDEMKKISFVILTWNSAGVIGACLDSIAKSDLPGCEIILVDNGSSDDTHAIVSSFTDDHRDIPVREIRLNKNYGTTVSRNQGIAAVSEDAEFVCILDSDTVINRQAMKELTEVLEADERGGIAGPHMVNAVGEEQITAKKIPTAFLKLCKAFPLKAVQRIGERNERYEFSGGKRSYPVGYLISACWMIPRKVIEVLGPLDEKIFYSPEDVEYCVRAWEKGYRVLYCPNAGIVHATQRISKKKLLSRHNWEHIKGLVYFFGKYHLFTSSERIICK